MHMRFFSVYNPQFKFSVEGKEAKSVSRSRFCDIQLREFSRGHFFLVVQTLSLYY